MDGWTDIQKGKHSKMLMAECRGWVCECSLKFFQLMLYYFFKFFMIKCCGEKKAGESRCHRLSTPRELWLRLPVAEPVTSASPQSTGTRAALCCRGLPGCQVQRIPLCGETDSRIRSCLSSPFSSSSLPTLPICLGIISSPFHLWVKKHL